MHKSTRTRDPDTTSTIAESPASLVHNAQPRLDDDLFPIISPQCHNFNPSTLLEALNDFFARAIGYVHRGPSLVPYSSWIRSLSAVSICRPGMQPRLTYASQTTTALASLSSDLEKLRNYQKEKTSQQPSPISEKSPLSSCFWRLVIPLQCLLQHLSWPQLMRHLLCQDLSTVVTFVLSSRSLIFGTVASKLRFAALSLIYVTPVFSRQRFGGTAHRSSHGVKLFSIVESASNAPSASRIAQALAAHKSKTSTSTTSAATATGTGTGTSTSTTASTSESSQVNASSQPLLDPHVERWMDRVVAPDRVDPWDYDALSRPWP
jgi:hypothetical protein